MLRTDPSEEIPSSPPTLRNNLSTPPVSPTLPASSTLLTSPTAFSMGAIDDTSSSTRQSPTSYSASLKDVMTIPPALRYTPPPPLIAATTDAAIYTSSDAAQVTMSFSISSKEILTIPTSSSPTLNIPPIGIATDAANKTTFTIRPSGIIKCSVMGRLKKAGYRSYQDLNTRLSADLYRLQQRQKMKKASRRRAAAEVAQSSKQDRELQLLRIAESRGFQWTSLDAQLALALARAARDALAAEEDAVRLHVEEVRFKLESLQDEVEDLHARTQEATQQVGALVDVFNERHITVDPCNLQLTYSLVHPPQAPSPADVKTPFESNLSDIYSSYSEDSEISDT